jgi:hypothetical protein
MNAFKGGHQCASPCALTLMEMVMNKFSPTISTIVVLRWLQHKLNYFQIFQIFFKNSTLCAENFKNTFKLPIKFGLRTSLTKSITFNPSNHQHHEICLKH